MKILGILMIGLLALGAQSAEPEKTLEALRAELRSELNPAAKDSAALDPKQSQIESTLSQLTPPECLNDEQLRQTIGVLARVYASSFSDKINELSQRLTTELRERSADRTKALSEKVDAALRLALSQGFKATTAKDLDLPLNEITKLQKEIQAFGYGENGRLVMNFEAFSGVQEMLTAIQDGLMSVGKNGYTIGRDPVERLRSMASNAGKQFVGLMPRSEFLEGIQAILERMSPGKLLTNEEYRKEIGNLLGSVKKLEDLDTVIAQIEELSARQREFGNEGSSSGTHLLKSFRVTYNELRDGSSTSMSFASRSDSDESRALYAIKNLLVKFAMPRVLRIPEERGPHEDEAALTYLQRMLTEATNESDWRLLTRILEVGQTMRLTTLATTSDTSALRQFLGGLNFARARHYSDAVACYLAALRSGSQIIPAEKIGELLDALKKDHPTEYEAGIQLSKTGYPFPDNSMLRSSVYSRTMQGLRTEPEPAKSTLIVPAVPKAAPPAAKETEKPVDPKPTTKGKE